MLLTDSCHILSFISFLIFFRTASNIVSPMRLFLLSSYISSHSFRRSLCLSNYRENSYCLILVLICSQLIERATSFARRVSFVIWWAWNMVDASRARLTKLVRLLLLFLYCWILVFVGYLIETSNILRKISERMVFLLASRTSQSNPSLKWCSVHWVSLRIV